MYMTKLPPKYSRRGTHGPRGTSPSTPRRGPDGHRDGIEDRREPDEPMLFDRKAEAAEPSRSCPQRSPVCLAVVFSTLRRQEVLNDEACDVAAQPSPSGEVEAEMNPREDTTERGFFGGGGETVE